ncbi:hypothetical protein BYT27DRAFT_7185351 [Phlegmacium glaucopus]|nr:hypothetical protein BYT27DRAFT_7185351 [Phlegmacium glaucopus]
MSTLTAYADSRQAQSPLSTAMVSTAHPSTTRGVEDDAGKKKKTTKRRKVNHACLYCRRSHMTCDEGRPCQRCIKRDIGHLCHDEHRPKVQDKPLQAPPAVDPTPTPSSSYAPAVTTYQAPTPQPTSSWPMSIPPYLYQPDMFGNEFSILTDFLETLDDGSFFGPPTVGPSLVPTTSFADGMTPTQNNALLPESPANSYPSNSVSNSTALETTTAILPAATKTEKFLLTAADQESGSRDERLNSVIQSKYEAGLLKPYNYVKGYARLSRWMDRNVSQESKQQILQPLSVLRPKFRAVAQSLRDLDLVFIEEAFERLLLDYDRVFSAMGVPACLWRRTGEIYKGNREFSELVGVEGYMMRDGRLCIYELMAEESAVNYWEKYGHVAFDSSQKAVLTSCVLRYKPVLNSGSSSLIKTDEEHHQPMEESFINCCFSFTIRRDKWGIPSMIVGNFIQC